MAEHYINLTVRYTYHVNTVTDPKFQTNLESGFHSDEIIT